MSISTVYDHQCTHNVIVIDAVGSPPTAHHEGVVERDHADEIHAVLFEVSQLLLRTREVLAGAGRSECA